MASEHKVEADVQIDSIHTEAASEWEDESM
jgi:hypothetical protein